MTGINQSNECQKIQDPAPRVRKASQEVGLSVVQPLGTKMLLGKASHSRYNEQTWPKSGTTNLEGSYLIAIAAATMKVLEMAIENCAQRDPVEGPCVTVWAVKVPPMGKTCTHLKTLVAEVYLAKTHDNSAGRHQASEAQSDVDTAPLIL